MNDNTMRLRSWPHNNPNYLEEVQGKNKARDLYVLERLADGGLQHEVAKEVNLNRTRVTQIAIANRSLLDKLTFTTKFATKAGRLRLAFRCLQGRISSKKDTIEILDYIRKEMDGDVQFRQQINQFINISDEELDSIITRGFQDVTEVERGELISDKKGDDER